MTPAGGTPMVPGNEHKDGDLVISPTGPEGKVYTDISLANLFSSHVHKLNVEKQLIWSRFTAMLVANSILLGLFGFSLKDVARIPSWWGIGVCVGGIGLCILWFKLTSVGWELMNRRLKEAHRFVWEGYPSPIGTRLYPELTGPQDRIRKLTFTVICVFGLLYLWLLFALLRERSGT